MPEFRWPARLSAWPPAKLNLGVMASAFLIFGFSLVFQAHRWLSTPAYHVLLEIFRAQVWGALFIVSGLALAAAMWQFAQRRWVIIVALMLSFTLTTGWMLSFIARYLTSPSTTPETWVSWLIFDFLLIKVAISLDHPAPDSPQRAGQQEISSYRQAVDDALTAAAEDQKALVLRSLVAASDRCRDAVSAACAAYGQALGAVAPAGAMPPGDLALQAIREARNALLRAEEAYARATGEPAPRTDPG